MDVHNVVLTYHMAHSRLDAFLHGTKHVYLHIRYRHCKHTCTYTLQFKFTCLDALLALPRRVFVVQPSQLRCVGTCSLFVRVSATMRVSWIQMPHEVGNFSFK